MKKRVSPFAAILIVLIALGVCWYIYTQIPLVPTVPLQPKGSNRPPPGTRAAKNIPPPGAASTKADSKADDKKTDPTGANAKKPDTASDKTAPDGSSGTKN